MVTHPGQGVVETFFKAYLIAPSEGLADGSAVKQVALVFAQPLAALLHHRAEGHATALANPLHHRADADRLAGGEMPGAAGICLQRYPQSGLHGIADVDEAALRIPAAVQLHRFAGEGAEHCPGNDAIELLAGSVDMAARVNTTGKP